VKLLRDRAVVALLAAEFVSSLGTQITWLALPWFVLTTTGSPQRMTWVIIAELLPMAAVGFFGGALAQRVGTRRTMLVCDLARVPLVAAIPLLYDLGHLPFWGLLALVAATGVFVAPYFAVRGAIVPELVGEDQTAVAQATAVFQAAQRATIFLGPTAAGVLIATIGPARLLYVDAATYLASFVLVGLFVHVKATVDANAAPDVTGALAGLRFVARDRLMRLWMTSFLLVEIGWTSLFATMPVLVVRHYGADPKVLGWIVGALGAGALVGAGVAYKIVERYDPLTLASTAFACQMAALWLVAVPAPWQLPFFALFVGGFFVSIVNSPTMALLTLRTPRALRTQVISVFGTLLGVAAPLGLVIVGFALARVDPRAVLVVVLALQTVGITLFVGAALSERASLRAAAVVDSAA
jgi:MFS family permease